MKIHYRCPVTKSLYAWCGIDLRGSLGARLTRKRNWTDDWEKVTCLRCRPKVAKRKRKRP